MSAKKQASKTAEPVARKSATVKLKKGDLVKFTGWNGAPPDDSDWIKKGMTGTVSEVNSDEIEVAMEDPIEGRTLVPFAPSEVTPATKADVAAPVAKAKGKAVQVEEDEDDEDEEPSRGYLADEGDKAAIRELTKLAAKADVDPNDYETWTDLETALSEDNEDEAVDYASMSIKELRAECAERDLSTKGTQAALVNRLEEDDAEEDAVAAAYRRNEVEEEEEAPVKQKREPSLGRKADEGDKVALKELTKRCKAVGVDSDDYETWTEVERVVKAEEAEAAKPKLRITKSIAAEIGEDESDAVPAAKRLVETAERTYYTLGGVLAVIHRRKLYEQVKVKGEKPFQGLTGFGEFCALYLKIEKRKALYLISIYEAFTAAGLTEAKIGSIGWSKAKELTAILSVEPEAADEWIELAKESGTEDVKEAVKARLKELGAKVHGNSKKVRVVTCKFTLHEDEGKVVEQALALATEQGECKSDSEAFAFIVKEWMTFQAPAPKKGKRG